jgi:hypothetical protein
MATESEHLKQAQHNRKFLNEIDHEKFPDWAATVAFYTAVHLVRSLLKRSGENCNSHSSRNKKLRHKYPNVWKLYQPLYSYSRLARYWCMRVKPGDVPYIVRRLNKVEREVQTIAKPKSSSP